MAGVTDPLEDVLYSAVDEKAVSDLVGSLESQLGSQNKTESEGRRAGVPQTGSTSSSGSSKLVKAQAVEAGSENGAQRAPSINNSLPVPVSAVGIMTTTRMQPNVTIVPKPVAPGHATSPNCSSDAAVVASSLTADALSNTNHLGASTRAGENGSGATQPASTPLPGLQGSVNGAGIGTTSNGTNSPFPSVQSNHVLSQPACPSPVPTLALHRPPPSAPDPKLPVQTAPITTNPGLIRPIPAPQTSQIKTIVPNQLAGTSVAVRSPLLKPVAPHMPTSASGTTLPVASTASVLVKPDAGQAAGILRPATPVPAPSLVRPGVAAAPAPRAVAPQVMVRPQQQTTIQLPPGFTIPQGMVLVRTETGQLVLVPQQVLAQAKAQTKAALSPTPAPSPTTTAGATFRVTTSVQPSPVTSQAIRPIPPAQAKVVQAATPISPAPQSPVVTVSTTPKPSAPTVITTGARIQTPQTLVKPGCTVSAPAAPTAGVPGLSQEMQENVKKCKNFLATLIKLASHNSPSPETSRNVKALVQDLLDAKIEPEEFTNRLQTELKSSPQPYLIPFLKKSLPALRITLLNSQQSLTQLAQASVPPSPLTVNAIKAPPPRSLAPTVRPTITPDNAATAIKRPGVQPVPVRMPVVITQTIRPQGTVVRGPAVPVGVALQASANQKQKLNDPGGGTFRDDDDINDVASMAGVNLNEENARILATGSELVGTQIRSCKDESFLPANLLHKRILEIARKFGVSDVMGDVVSLVSHATENRLRSMLENVSALARHRTEACKDEEQHEQSSDVRTQLKFFEQLERMEKQRKDDEEREILLKVAKSRSRQEDPEQARLKQKAKEMQQQELAQIRQRDANLTALAAIGPRKKRKLDSPGASGAEASGSSSGTAGASSSSSSRQVRQRITRVNLRDLIFCLEQERSTSRSLLLYKALLK
ncbi:transcription initiation factor TFIID subunit 4 [Trichomycterus rosablanca]|uniref:transcription initiation factor TFIID subunit 4 n=1 Tax=Trichomycterus rosablanca TaxID=2290929 RepID=UPI002F35D901